MPKAAESRCGWDHPHEGVRRQTQLLHGQYVDSEVYVDAAERVRPAPHATYAEAVRRDQDARLNASFIRRWIPAKSLSVMVPNGWSLTKYVHVAPRVTGLSSPSPIGVPIFDRLQQFIEKIASRAQVIRKGVAAAQRDPAQAVP